jgi:lysophospholipase L1-like esterase
MKHCPFTTKIFFALFPFIFPGVMWAQTFIPESPVRFLALGDSYTIGESVPTMHRWPIQLSDSLQARGITVDTLNIIATTGWRTDNLISAISNKKLEAGRYNFVSVLIGVNNQYQGRPFAQYQLEFPALLDSAVRYAGGDKNHVFVVSIPDYAYTPYGQQSGNPAQITAQLNQYNAFAKHIADSLHITFFDITPISRQGLQNTAYVAGDGLHPSGAQYTQWVKLMLQQVDNTGTNLFEPEVKNKLAINVNPNPATDKVKVELGEMPAKRLTRLELYSTNGVLVQAERMDGATATLAMNDLPAGTYFLRAINGDKQVVKRLIKR